MLKPFSYSTTLEKENTEEHVKFLLKNKIRKIQYIKDFPEELQLFAVKEKMHAIFYIKNPTKKVVLETFANVYEENKNIKTPLQIQLLLQLKNNELLNSLGEKREESFHRELQFYKKELENIRYFQNLLEYVIKNREKWVIRFIDSLSPLTKEQENIWKQHRLKTLL